MVIEVVKARYVRCSKELQITLEGMVDQLIKEIIDADKKLSDMVSLSMMDSVEWMTMKLLVRQLFKSKDHVENIWKRLDKQKKELTRWDLYNAITNYAAHGERLSPHVESFLQCKAAEIFTKSFHKLIDIKKIIE